MLGEGIGLAQGGVGYQGTITHIPTVGGGFRFSPTHGFEASAVLSRSFDGQNLSVSDPRPYPPDYNGLAGNFLLMRGSPRLPFSAMIGAGAGAYRERGESNTLIGFQGFIDSIIRPTNYGSLDGPCIA